MKRTVVLLLYGLFLVTPPQKVIYNPASAVS